VLFMPDEEAVILMRDDPGQVALALERMEVTYRNSVRPISPQAYCQDHRVPVEGREGTSFLPKGRSALCSRFRCGNAINAPAGEPVDQAILGVSRSVAVTLAPDRGERIGSAVRRVSTDGRRRCGVIGA
jgi:hypothetical protein